MEPLQAGDPAYIGVYRLTDRLGAGGMGQVFLGVSPGGRKVAVKLMHPAHSADKEFRERFAREIAAARQVGGFHTALVVDADPAADPPWMVTAYIAGPSLAEVVRNAGPLEPAAVRALGAGLAEGLSAVHAAGLIHRDLKPGNVIMAEDGPRIIDFGIARAVDATALTSSGVLIGTFSFMSPEQVRGEWLGPASDCFSLGSVLAFAATGHGPFDAPSVPAIIYRIATEPPDLGSLTGPLRDVISACLAKNPADRPTIARLLSMLSDPSGQSAQRWKTASANASPPGVTPPPRQPTETSTPARGGGGATRNPAQFPVRRTAALAAACAAALGIALGIVFSTHDSTGSQADAPHTTVTSRPASRPATSSAPASGQARTSSAPASTTAAPASSGGSTTPPPPTGTTVCTTPAVGCTGYAAASLRTEPSIITSSADGAVYIKDLTWTGWGTATAKGTGTMEADNCKPNCAEGHDTAYPATVTVTRPRPYGDGLQAYSVIAVNSPATPPGLTFSTGLVP